MEEYLEKLKNKKKEEVWNEDKREMQKWKHKSQRRRVLFEEKLESIWQKENRSRNRELKERENIIWQ